MSSSTKQTKLGVQISKETGGAYADMREVIESELTRIREEWARKSNTNGAIRGTESHTGGNVHRPK